MLCDETASNASEKQGNVVIQTYEPEHYSVLAAAKQDYDKFCKTEMIIRESMNYPPFSDLIQVAIINVRSHEMMIAVREKDPPPSPHFMVV